MLATDFNALILKTIVAVLLTLSGANILVILKSLGVRFVRWSVGNAGHGVNQPLLGPQHGNSRNGLIARFKDVRSGREFLAHWRELLRDISQGEAGLSFLEQVVLTLIGTVILGLFVTFVVAGVFSANIETDHAALLASNKCGIWMFDNAAGEEAASHADLRDIRKETQAGDYAKSCVHPDDAPDPKGCGLFYQRKIDYTSESVARCPFASPAVCYDGLFSATAFDTGLVSLNSIGINSEVDYKFRRRSTCAPLNMDFPFVQNKSDAAGDDAYFYYYGNITDEASCAPENHEYTLKTTGHPFDWFAPGYSLRSV